jgi:hypothetical protein
MNSATPRISAPRTAARMMFHRSGRLAKRHSPRYRPKRQDKAPCTTTTSGSAPSPAWRKAGGGSSKLKRASIAMDHAATIANRS